MELSHQHFDKLRQVGDPTLDPIMADLKENGQVQEVNDLLMQIIENHTDIPAALPDNIEFWLREKRELPADVDRERLARSSAFFVEHGALITLILSTAALVTCYAGSKGSKVLTFSYRMGQNPYHRIAETGQFVLLVMDPDGFGPHGKAITTCLKVRLMHSAVRYLVRRTGKWDEIALGVPICQEDLLGTLMVFSAGVLEGLKRLGATIRDEDAEDYYYGWQVIGRLMGIRPENIPANVAEATAVAHFIAQRQFGPSPEGVYLTRSLINMHSDLIPGTMFDGIVPALIRHIAGEEVADWMEVPQTRWQGMMNHATKMGQFLDVLDTTFGGIDKLIDKLAIALLMRNSIAVNDYKRAAFHIPAKLKLTWGEEE
ncbi:MAG: DUF2236 domain-containing protein [Chloroflexi bacterium]|nr:DUF2236 domain-containing protein [Chloroflexota bacterium]